MPNMQPVIRVGLQRDRIKEATARVQPWTTLASSGSPASAEEHLLKLEQAPDADATLSSLAFIRDSRNQLLEVLITFEGGGSAYYLWRLNPPRTK